MTRFNSADSIPKSNKGSNEDSMDYTLNRTFDLLRDRRRRYVLETLYTSADTAVSVGDLADRLVERDPDAADRDRVLVGLHHRTLPRLADDDVVGFDPRTDVVRYHGGEPIDDLLAVLVRENEPGFHS